jgi:signal transduction histidine kinase
VVAGYGPADSRLPARQPASKANGSSGKPGRGILGMRERCQLLGGELDAKPTASGGFEVTARLPLVPVGSG